MKKLSKISLNFSNFWQNLIKKRKFFAHYEVQFLDVKFRARKTQTLTSILTMIQPLNRNSNIANMEISSWAVRIRSQNLREVPRTFPNFYLTNSKFHIFVAKFRCLKKYKILLKFHDFVQNFVIFDEICSKISIFCQFSSFLETS